MTVSPMKPLLLSLAAAPASFRALSLDSPPGAVRFPTAVVMASATVVLGLVHSPSSAACSRVDERSCSVIASMSDGSTRFRCDELAMSSCRCSCLVMLPPPRPPPPPPLPSPSPAQAPSPSPSPGFSFNSIRSTRQPSLSLTREPLSGLSRQLPSLFPPSASLVSAFRSCRGRFLLPPTPPALAALVPALDVPWESTPSRPRSGRSCRRLARFRIVYCSFAEVAAPRASSGVAAEGKSLQRSCFDAKCLASFFDGPLPSAERTVKCTAASPPPPRLPLLGANSCGNTWD
mmetsp:Transcript_72918/g.207754  ORF Transcript_72918/g.207754 Transcript_72918/m.207754 type:complete len:289 (+) Transcript_72918:366-1232(+)